MSLMWLFASYQVKLPKPILVKSESADPIVLMANLRGWDSEVTLIPSARSGRIKQPRDGGWYYPVSQLEITVIRDGELGDELMHEEAAKAIVERLLVFLQFKMSCSLFQAIEKYEQYFSNSDTSTDQAESDHIENIEPQLSLVVEYKQQSMRDYMSEYFSKELAKCLLHDAAISVANSRSRRACLELCMACESALGLRLKSAMLVKASMGSVFINQHSQEYEALIQLFKARDALKQGSGGLFKFVSASKKRQIQQDLTRWQGAVECLANWLDAMDKGLQGAL